MLLVGFVVGYCTRPQTAAIVKTEYRTDTLRIVTPAEVSVDTFMREVFVPVKQKADTVFRTDSILVYLPFERKVYEDSTYRAVISGYKPVLEEIDVYVRETTIHKEKTQPKLSPFVIGGIGSNGSISIGGGIFIKDKNAFALELETRGKTKNDLQLEVKYIHKF
jgi:hypothetical protein